MKTIFTGGLAAVCLIGLAASAGAQIHNTPVVMAPPRAYSTAPRPHPVAATAANAAGARHMNKRSHRFHDCMRRYGDRKGCYYLAWHKHWRHAGPMQGK